MLDVVGTGVCLLIVCVQSGGTASRRGRRGKGVLIYLLVFRSARASSTASFTSPSPASASTACSASPSTCKRAGACGANARARIHLPSSSRRVCACSKDAGSGWSSASPDHPSSKSSSSACKSSDEAEGGEERGKSRRGVGAGAGAGANYSLSSLSTSLTSSTPTSPSRSPPSTSPSSAAGGSVPGEEDAAGCNAYTPASGASIACARGNSSPATSSPARSSVSPTSPGAARKQEVGKEDGGVGGKSMCSGERVGLRVRDGPGGRGVEERGPFACQRLRRLGLSNQERRLARKLTRRLDIDIASGAELVVRGVRRGDGEEQRRCVLRCHYLLPHHRFQFRL
ncbi:hypothetical protein C8R46DRAFT_312092 [Mycena filopes]|nr:hypothetical protein C8R46DRAFT_312092 [Mycena filopes]